MIAGDPADPTVGVVLDRRNGRLAVRVAEPPVQLVYAGAALALTERTGHSTIAITEDGTPTGKFVGIITSRDYRLSKTPLSTPVRDLMTPFRSIHCAKVGLDLPDHVQRLAVPAVLDVLARFAHGIDGRDWALYRSVFTDEIDVDYTSYRAGSAGRMPADAWVERARRLFPGLDATTHVLVNAWFRPDDDAGDSVLVQTSMRADHFLDGARYTLGGGYLHRAADAAQTQSFGGFKQA